MRRSLEDIACMVRDIPYPKQLPEELERLLCYLVDSGHCILAVPKALLPEAKASDAGNYEVPLPAKYVIEKGWEPIPGTDSIVVDVPYDNDFGALVPDGYEEF